ncbi:rod-binding protein [Microbaculum sp. FT89]|uniref:rod-binding protein n=1 Tax=Microbaculum sp. FT89 TaxID=3447298 RepID=UPI003F535952
MAIPVDLALSSPAHNPALTAGAKGTPESVRQAAQEFESVFLNTMLSQMFAGVSTDGPFGGGHGEEMFRSLLLEEYGANIAAAGGIGIADDVARELLSLQEANNDIQQ